MNRRKLASISLTPYECIDLILKPIETPIYVSEACGSRTRKTIDRLFERFKPRIDLRKSTIDLLEHRAQLITEQISQFIFDLWVHHPSSISLRL